MATAENPALGADGKLKDASEIEFYNSEGDEAPIPKGGTAATASGGENTSSTVRIAPAKITPSLPRRSRDEPDQRLILEGTRQRRPAARADDVVSNEAQEFFRPKGSRYVHAYPLLLYIINLLPTRPRSETHPTVAKLLAVTCCQSTRTPMGLWLMEGAPSSTWFPLDHQLTLTFLASFSQGHCR